MTRTYCTKDYNLLTETLFNWLTKENSKYTIDEDIKQLGIFVQGFKKYQKSHNYWVNFKPFDNPKDTPQAWANSIHFASIEKPEESIYVKGMNTQKLQFEATERAIYKYMDYMKMTDKERNKIIRKIETRKNKLN